MLARAATGSPRTVTTIRSPVVALRLTSSEMSRFTCRVLARASPATLLLFPKPVHHKSGLSANYSDLPASIDDYAILNSLLTSLLRFSFAFRNEHYLETDRFCADSIT